MSKKIGFIGLGRMGFPMAINLKKAGFEVIGYDAFKGVYEKAAAEGITMVDTLKEVAEQADEAIISIVRDYAQNVDVLFGEGGLVSANQTDKTVIVMSTLSPDAMKALEGKLKEESDLHLISAAVSGGESGAQAGTMSIMASGAENLVKAAQPYFDAVGINTFYFGEDVGNSQAAKLINNQILGININAVAEGLKLAEKFTLPEEELLKLFQASTGDSWVARNWSDVSQWDTENTLSVLLKDMVATYNEGIKHNVSLPFNALASTQLFKAMGEDRVPKI